MQYRQFGDSGNRFASVVTLIAQLGLCTACQHVAPEAADTRRTEPPASTAAPKPRHDAPPTVAAEVPDPPLMLLGRVPNTHVYRVIACSRGPGEREKCSKELEAKVGERVSFAGGNDSAKIEKVVEIWTGDGTKQKAFDLGAGGVSVAIFPANAAKVELVRADIDRDDIDVLKGATRKLSPLAKWASGWSFEASPYLANLAGSFDRIAITRIEDRKASDHRELHAVFVALGDQPFQLVEMSTEAQEAFGRVDVDADGRDEFLFSRNGPIEGAYDYRLQRVLPSKPLAMAGNVPSEAWQPYDRLEDHNHSDE
jgi:hypothetical protein